MNHKIFLFLITALIFFSACKKDDDAARSAVSSLIGTELNIPDYDCVIDGDTIGNLPQSDYTIITYIDGEGCTPCRMKLMYWRSAMDEFNSITGAEVAYLLIIGGEPTEEILNSIHAASFPHPVTFDSKSIFASLNEIPEREDLRTFLLDDDNRVLAIGNPVLNPKVRKFYNKLIAEAVDAEPDDAFLNICEVSCKAIGFVAVGDTAEVAFTLSNNFDHALTFEEVVPSCDCTSVSFPNSQIPSGRSISVTLRYVGEPGSGKFSRYADIFFKEKESPQRVFICGYK